MQNRTFLVLFRPIFGEILKTAPPPKGNWVPKSWSRCRDLVWKSVWITDLARKISLNFGEDLFFFLETTCFWAEKTFEFPNWAENSASISVKTFFFWRPPVFGRKKRLNFRAFWEIPSQFLDKPYETDSRTMKIRVKVVCTFLTLSKKPPLFPNPGYAPGNSYAARASLPVDLPNFVRS